MGKVESIPHIGDVVCAIIEKDDRFLIAQRPEGKSLALLWEFPGGKVEAGEEMEEALKRELCEELHVEIVVIRPLSPSFHAYHDFSLRLVPFLCRLSKGEPRSLEHKELRWIKPEDIALYAFPEADLPVLEEYLDLIAGRKE